MKRFCPDCGNLLRRIRNILNDAWMLIDIYQCPIDRNCFMEVTDPLNASPLINLNHQVGNNIGQLLENDLVSAANTLRFVDHKTVPIVAFERMILSHIPRKLTSQRHPERIMAHIRLN